MDLQSETSVAKPRLTLPVHIVKASPRSRLELALEFRMLQNITAETRSMKTMEDMEYQESIK